VRPLAFVQEELGALSRSGLRRTLREMGGPQDRVMSVDGLAVINFSSNNYLGLANDPGLQAAAADGLRAGTGAGGSRLIVGNLEAHRAVERELAAYFEREAALAFNSGYQANIGVLQALAGPEDIVFSDELNHASLIDGCRLSRASVRVFPHGDLEHLDAQLRISRARRTLIVTDALFSMDGDRADVPGLAAVAERHGAGLIVDEAHAVGILGPGGRGVCAEAGVAPHVLVGTFGKALGSFGAFVAADRDVIELIKNRARSFVFTTALPPAVMAANREAVRIVCGDRGDRLRAALQQNIAELGQMARSAGLSLRTQAGSPIVPLVVGEAAAAMECAERLLRAGYYAQGIRPPTVPVGSSRLRLTVMANHTAEDLAGLVDALAGLARERMFIDP
jgi:8-amino-7-oxononanoate synthase